MNCKGGYYGALNDKQICTRFFENAANVVAIKMIGDDMYCDLLVFDTYNERRTSSFCGVKISNKYLKSNIKLGTKILVAEMFCKVVERNDDLWYEYECTKGTIVMTLKEYAASKKSKIA